MDEMERDDSEYTPIQRMTAEELKSFWPNLNQHNYSITSPPAKVYNCVAWASGINYTRLDFYRNEKGEIDEDQSSFRYMKHFETIGFVECESPDFEEGFEKIALYEDRRGNFTHVALQKGEDRWTSKLGYLEDIEHKNLEALEGRGRDRYGNHVFYMKRQKG